MTNEERREVARRLRCDLKDARASGHYCSDSEAVRYICDILGLRCSRCPHPWAGLEALADLIEPSCDRDALSALADNLDSSASMLLKQNDLDPNRKRRGMRRDHAQSLMAASGRIREACGNGGE